MDLKQRLRTAILQAVYELYNLELEEPFIQLSVTNKEQSGHFTLLVFPFSKYKLGSPEAIGRSIADRVIEKNSDWISNVDTIKGFVNFTISDLEWARFLGNIITDRESLLSINIGKGRNVMVEFCSPNTNKPLHVGHLRNIFLGDSIANLMTACGYNVYRSCLFNDKGIHICKSMYAYTHFNPENYKTPQEAGQKGDHFVAKYYVRFEKEYQKQVKELIADGMPKEEAIKKAPLMQEISELYRQWEAGNKEILKLWETMNSWVYEGMNQTFTRVKVHFDKFYYESETYLLGKDIIQEGLDRNLFYRRDDSSVWIDLKAVKLDEKVLLRSDGTSVYITQDLGTADLKYKNFNIEKSIYVIGNEQEYHMKVLIEILKRMNRTYANGMYHLSYGMIELPEGKMKTREGNVVDADDLISEMIQNAAETTEQLGKTEGLSPDELKELYHDLALGAIKYFILKVDAVKNMIFNPKESIDFKGHTGTFIQFNGARMQSILRKGNSLGISVNFDPNNLIINEFEYAILRKIHEYPRELFLAADLYNPAGFANYIYELAKDYSRFYNECPVLTDENTNVVSFRMALTQMTFLIIEKGMNILGINVPSRM